ncbi:MAG: hypothetical protein Kow0098_00100 [Ignavibacteriaceae bacterium]
MFIGHFGAGMAAKKVEQKVSIGTYFIAAQFIDLIWPFLLLLGLEKVEIQPGLTESNPLNFTHYPFSHSLLAVAGWGILVGVVYYLFKKNLKISVILGLLVLSHWILDLLVHIPDLPLLPWGNLKVGFGLWNNLTLSLTIETIIFAAGIYLYLTSVKFSGKKDWLIFWSLIIFLYLIHLMNLFGTPPPDAQTIGLVGLSQWIIVAWAYLADKNTLRRG